MNLATIVLLAALICAEAPNGTMRERYYIAQTIVYRAEAKSLPVDSVIWQPKQYQGLALIDWEAYRIYRMAEMRTNAQIAAIAVLYGPQVEVSNFCAIGSHCKWEADCELKVLSGGHKFYICPKWQKGN